MPRDFECRLVKRLAPLVGKHSIQSPLAFNPSDEDMKIVSDWFANAQHAPDDEPLPIDALYYRAAEVKGGLSTADIIGIAGAYESFMKGRFKYAMLECAKKTDEE